MRGAFVGTTIAIAALLGAGRLLAGTVEISVVERGAGPVPNQPVVLYPAGTDSRYAFPHQARKCVTGLSGRCEVAGLAAGAYYPFLTEIVDANLCAPAGSPIDAYGTVTLVKPEDTASLRIELHRGVRIQFRVIAGRVGIPKGSKIALRGDTGEEVSVPVDGLAARATVRTGRWIAHLEGQGARVTKVELDGAAMETLDVPIEVVAPSSDRFVTWTLSDPCTVYGLVTSTRQPPAVEVRAQVLTPGPWATSPFCRAENCAGSPGGRVVRNGDFEFQVPSGTWRVAPAGDSLIESTPPFIELSCAEGQWVRANFSVKETEGGGPGGVLRVEVVDEERQPIAGVPVEAWPPGGKLSAKAPLETASTGPYSGPAVFKRLAEGDYLVRARHPGYRTAVVAVNGLDPEERQPRHAVIELDKGATIEATATDEAGRPVRGVGLEVTRTDAPPQSGDPAAVLAEEDVVRVVPPSNDQTGHVVVSGLAGGTYDVRPTLSASIASEATAAIAGGDGKSAEHVTVVLGDHERKELSVRLRPAASFSGRLVCVDGGLMPREVDTCILGLPAEGESEAARDACRAPAIPARVVKLSGDASDTFRVGPLTDGSYRLGLRPRGYAAWTWALGTPDGAQAAALQVQGSGPVELGIIKAYCGPAVELRPSVASRDPAPDLTAATVAAALTRTDPRGKLQRRVVPAVPDRDRIMLRELPEGEWTLDVTVSHPFFVPPAPVHLLSQVKLERGAIARAGVDVASIGGAIAIEASADAARLSAADGTSRVEETHNGKLGIEGVAPGTYRVELCENKRCDRTRGRWDDVRVVPGRTVVLRPELGTRE